MTQFDTIKLSERIAEKYGTRKACAKATGISEASLSRYFNGERELTMSQLRALQKALGIKAKDLDVYFFTEKVAQKQP